MSPTEQDVTWQEDGALADVKQELIDVEDRCQAEPLERWTAPQ